MARGGMSTEQEDVIMTIRKRRNTTIFKSLDLLLIYKDDGGSENSLTFTTKVINTNIRLRLTTHEANFAAISLKNGGIPHENRILAQHT